MDKILFASDNFDIGQFNILLIIPVIFVFISAALVFIFGFKKPEQPTKFHKKLLHNDPPNQIVRKISSSKKKSTVTTTTPSVASNSGTTNEQLIKKSSNKTKIDSKKIPSISLQQQQSQPSKTQTKIKKKVINHAPIKPVKSDSEDAITDIVIAADNGWKTVTSKTEKKLKKGDTTKNSVVIANDYLGNDSIRLKVIKANNKKSISPTTTKITKSTLKKSNGNNNSNFDNNNELKIPQHMTSDELEEFVNELNKKLSWETSKSINNNSINDVATAAIVKTEIKETTPRIDDSFTQNTSMISGSNKHDKTQSSQLIEGTLNNSHNEENDIFENITLKTSKLPNVAKTTNRITTSSSSFIENEKKDSVIPVVATSTSGNVMFDELGDAWTEAKTQKKSKKRVRKE